MANLNAELLDGGCHHTPDFNGLTVFGRDVWVGGIGRLEPDATISLVQLLDRKVPVNNGHHDVVVPRFDGFVDHQDVLVVDASLGHRMPTRAQEVSGLLMGDQELTEVDALGAQVFGRRRKASFDLATQQQRLQR